MLSRRQKSLQMASILFSLMFWIIHHGCILPTPSTIIIFFIGWRGESSICVVPRHSIEQQNLCLYHLHDGLEYKKHFFSPLTEQSCFIDYIFFLCIYEYFMKAEGRKKTLFSSLLPHLFFIYLMARKWKYRKKRKREQRKNGSFLCSP